MTYESAKIREATKPASKRMKAQAFRAYSSNAPKKIEQDRITDFLPMVTNIVSRVVSYLKPPLTFEDLVSAGTVGLIKAAKDYDASHNAEFKTYAYIRIKGAVLDELRGWSFIPNTVNRKLKEAEEASRRLTDKTGNVPTNSELANELGISESELNETFKKGRARQFLSMDGKSEDAPALGDFLAAANVTDPEEQVQKAELIEQLSKAIQELPEKQRQVILLYYQQHLTMKETAKVFDITESRVSQLHASALFNLSVKLKQYKDVR